MSGRKYIAQQDNTSIPNIPIPQKLEYVSPEVRDKMWNLPKHSISTYRESVLPTNIRNIQKRQEENRQLQIQDAKNVEKALPVIEAGLDVASLIPAVGAVGKGASFVLKQGVKQAAKQAAKQTVNQIVKRPVQTAATAGMMLAPAYASASNNQDEQNIVGKLWDEGYLGPEDIFMGGYLGIKAGKKLFNIAKKVDPSKLSLLWGKIKYPIYAVSYATPKVYRGINHINKKEAANRIMNTPESTTIDLNKYIETTPQYTTDSIPSSVVDNGDTVKVTRGNF